MAQSGQNHVAREKPSRKMPLERFRLAAERLARAQFEDNETLFTALLIICQALSSLREKHPSRPQLPGAFFAPLAEAVPAQKNPMH